MREDNSLPAITGRVCPQESQCEGGCIVGIKGQPVAIGNLERFIADFERDSGQLGLPEIAPSTGKSIAIVGSGPAGLSAAGDLIQKGHRVRVFEALHELGGVLVYGIPEFRLPKEIVASKRSKTFAAWASSLKPTSWSARASRSTNSCASRATTPSSSPPAPACPVFMDIPGEHLNGVYSANEFLTRVNLMRAWQFPQCDEPVYDCRDRNVIVVGGGNTAMDAVRTARRLGARSAKLVYRRSEAEMPARAEEVKHARQEGIEICTLTNPIEFMGDEKGWLTGARCVRMELGEPDAERPPPRRPSFPAPSTFCRRRGHHRHRHHGQSAHPEHHARPQDRQAQLHRRRS